MIPVMFNVSPAQANAYDKMIDAAAELAELIEDAGVQVDELDLEKLTIFLAKNASEIKHILKRVPAQ